MTSSLNPNFLESSIVVPNIILEILAQWHAPKHIGHGSVVQKIAQPLKSIEFNSLQALRIAFISAWAVTSVFFQTALWAYYIGISHNAGSKRRLSLLNSFLRLLYCNLHEFTLNHT